MNQLGRGQFEAIAPYAAPLILMGWIGTYSANLVFALTVAAVLFQIVWRFQRYGRPTKKRFFFGLFKIALVFGAMVIILDATQPSRLQANLDGFGDKISANPEKYCPKVEAGDISSNSSSTVSTLTVFGVRGFHTVQSGNYKGICDDLNYETDYFKGLRYAVRGMSDSEKKSFFLSKADEVCPVLKQFDRTNAVDHHLDPVTRFNFPLKEACFYWRSPEERAKAASDAQEQEASRASDRCPFYYSLSWFLKPVYRGLKYCERYPQYASAEEQAKYQAEQAAIENEKAQREEQKAAGSLWQ